LRAAANRFQSLEDPGCDSETIQLPNVSRKPTMNDTSASAIQQWRRTVSGTARRNTEQQACSVERAAEPGGKPHPAPGARDDDRAAARKALLHPEPVELSIEQPHGACNRESAARVEGVELAEVSAKCSGWSDTAR
jgi:hypothetical protein